MESSEDVEALSRAMEKLLDQKRKREAAGDAFTEDDDDHLLLSKLVSQLESSVKPKEKTDETTKEEEQSVDSSPTKEKREGQRDLEESLEEIAKDIKKMKRQNTLTQVLLSAMILLTLTWQLSEFSMIFMMKDRLSHPIRSIGGMLSGMFKGKIRPFKNQLHGSKEEDNLNNTNNGSNNGDHLQMPELLQDFGLNDDEN